MSVKSQALVWDLECPKEYNGLMFKPSHKFVLIAYADHADHHGKNIYPAISTIALKTGLDARSIQRLTHDLQSMGLIVDDGMGPRGTNRWSLPYAPEGDKLSPLEICQGDKNPESLGDISSGDISSGDNLSPELKEPEPLLINNIECWKRVKDELSTQMKNGNFRHVKETQALRYDGNTLVVGALDQESADWLESRLTSTVERLLVGILNREVKVVFTVAQDVLVEEQ